MNILLNRISFKVSIICYLIIGANILLADGGSSLKFGCMDPDACNYDVDATQESGMCNYSCFGCTDPDASNYNYLATIDNGNCKPKIEIKSVKTGCMDPFACDYNPDATIEVGACDYRCWGCMDTEACNYNPSATINKNCTYPVEYYDCEGNCMGEWDLCDVCEGDSLSCLGCTEPNAINYDWTASLDDGSCIYENKKIRGCTSEDACNYTSNANIDDGSCWSPPPSYNCDFTCIEGDNDGDGICDDLDECTDVEGLQQCPDLYGIYVCGSIKQCPKIFPFLEIEGCLDSDACNYNSSATINKNCTYPVEYHDCDGNYTNTIEEIIISGNEFTNDSTILNLISHSQGDSINIRQAIEDQATLFNSGLFYDAIIYPDNSIYYIFVFEKPKTLVRPEVDKHDILGWSYGGSVLFNNIKGENRKLKIRTLVGASTLIDLKYCQPKLQHTNDSLNINLYNKFYNNIENNYKIYSRGIKTSIALFTKNTLYQIRISNQLEYSKLFFENGTYEKNYSMINALTYELNQWNNMFKIKLSHILFQNTYKNYFSINLENKYYIYSNGNKDSARLLIRNKLKINYSNNIPVYNKDYLISENYVRGYDIHNIPENSNIIENLLWNNMMIATIQIELPFYNTGFISTDLLLFWDWGVGFNNYKHYELNNKIRSFGLGVRAYIMKMGSVDICVGMNPYNSNKETQVIVNFTSF